MIILYALFMCVHLRKSVLKKMRLPIIYLTFITSFMTKLTLCNESPIIGILTQETYWSSFRNVLPINYSYIAASYVKAVESSGGRVIPVFTNRTTTYYEWVTMHCNTILIAQLTTTLSNFIGK